MSLLQSIEKFSPHPIPHKFSQQILLSSKILGTEYMYFVVYWSLRLWGSGCLRMVLWDSFEYWFSCYLVGLVYVNRILVCDWAWLPKWKDSRLFSSEHLLFSDISLRYLSLLRLKFMSSPIWWLSVSFTFYTFLNLSDSSLDFGSLF